MIPPVVQKNEVTASGRGYAIMGKVTQQYCLKL